MTCPDEILHLIDRFRFNVEAYHSGQYNETQLRREFLDPFFTALGWDVENKQGYAEAYKDVIHEDAIKVGGATKAPDYCFRIGGTRKFFVEAKKPSANLKDEISPAYQLRRYAWSAKLPLSILSDFEEFAVYDCRVKPASSDTAATARTLYIEYEQYSERWEEIASIFSREAVLKGSFDKYAESTKAKKGLFSKIIITDARRSPLPRIELSNASDKSRHDRMVEMVEHMLTLHKQLASAKTEHEKTALQRQIDATDKQIDQLVYELYGLTEEEIKIVEGM